MSTDTALALGVLGEVGLALEDALHVGEQVVDHPAEERDQALGLLIEGQVEFVVGSRAIARVYHQEIANLPAEDRSRLRRKQRLYLEDWVHLIYELRPGLDDVTARPMVHAAISAIQSARFHIVGLPEQRLRLVLVQSALAVLLDPGPF